MFGIDIAYRDLLLSVLLVLYALVLLSIPVDPKDTLRPPGNMFIYTTWVDNGNKNDVDTWMLTPKMAKPIGYDNKDSVTCNLVKDDLGTVGSAGSGNYENIFCREVPDGDYQINLHAYEITDVPLQVTVQVSMVINGVIKVLFEEKVTLTNNKDEQVVVRFKIKDGRVDPDSINHVFVSLYDMR